MGPDSHTPQPLDHPLNARVMSVGVETLRAARHKVLASGGRERAAQDAAFDVVLADADVTSPDALAEVSSARIVPLSSRRDTEAVPKSDRHALLDAIERAIRTGEAA